MVIFIRSEDFVSIITESNILTGKCFDLADKQYHGGTTFSSGVLPKWDVLDKRYMIKRCGIDSFGNVLSDAFNEELVYKFCVETGIDCAYYRAVEIKYFDNERKKIMQCPAVITKIFPGELIHYRVLRSQFKFGSVNDEFIDFTDRFAVQLKMNDLLFIDYIFNQQDRHSKNIGIVGDSLSPIFDSGPCLFYDVMDNLLTNDLVELVPRHKTFGKKLDELLYFSLKYVNSNFSFRFNETALKETVDLILCNTDKYEKKRLDFIRYLLKERIIKVGQILAEV